MPVGALAEASPPIVDVATGVVGGIDVGAVTKGIVQGAFEIVGRDAAATEAGFDTELPLCWDASDICACSGGWIGFAKIPMDVCMTFVVCISVKMSVRCWVQDSRHDCSFVRKTRFCCNG